MGPLNLCAEAERKSTPSSLTSIGICPNLLKKYYKDLYGETKLAIEEIKDSEKLKLKFMFIKKYILKEDDDFDLENYLIL